MGILTRRLNKLDKAERLKDIFNTWVLFHAFILNMFSRI